MKRDCGSGQLKPHHYVLKWHTGTADKEAQATYPTLEEAQATFEAKRHQLTTRGADIRLYVADKAGYHNCILSASGNPSTIHTNRLNELEETLQ